MKLERIQGKFTVCQIKNTNDVSFNGELISLTRTKDEISLVCPTETVPQNCIKREDGWACLKVAGTLEFSLIGILARISGILAEHGISIFVVSTFDTDYILTKQETIDRACTVLRKNGYQIHE